MIDIKYLIIGLIILLVIVFLYTNEHFGGGTTVFTGTTTGGDISVGTGVGEIGNFNNTAIPPPPVALPQTTKVLSYDEFKSQALSRMQDQVLRNLGLTINDLDIILKLGHFNHKYDVYGKKMKELLYTLGEPNNQKVTELIQKIYGIPEPDARSEALEILDKIFKYDINKIRNIAKIR